MKHCALFVSLVSLAMLGCTSIVQIQGKDVAAAVDPSKEPVILIATKRVDNWLYSRRVLFAKPLKNGLHIGFILNLPTTTTLGTMYPRHESSKKADSPIYLGGPSQTNMLFAIVKTTESPGGNSIKLSDNLFLVVEATVIDELIDKEAARVGASGGHKTGKYAKKDSRTVRFVLGFVPWRPGELDHELRQNAWHVIGADSEVILRQPTNNLWEELSRQAELKEKMI